MYCRNCGRPLTSYTKFCAYCGTPVDGCITQNRNDMEKKAEGSSGSDVAALVCGILGLVFCWTVIPGIVLGIIALILGMGILKKNPGPDNGKAIAGIVLGLTGLVLSVLIVVLIIWGFTQIPDMTGIPVYTA